MDENIKFFEPINIRPVTAARNARQTSFLQDYKKNFTAIP